MILTIVGVIVVLFGLAAFFGAPYVPSQSKYVRRAFDHFKLGKKDVLVDAGSGDGIVLRIAASYGARAVGFEINPLLVGLSKLISLTNSRIEVKLANFWTTELPDDTTIVYAFSVKRDESKLIGTLQREANRLERPLRLVCYGSPLQKCEAKETFDAYHLYTFQPLQLKKA